MDIRGLGPPQTGDKSRDPPRAHSRQSQERENHQRRVRDLADPALITDGVVIGYKPAHCRGHPKVDQTAPVGEQAGDEENSVVPLSQSMKQVRREKQPQSDPRQIGNHLKESTG